MKIEQKKKRGRPKLTEEEKEARAVERKRKKEEQELGLPRLIEEKRMAENQAPQDAGIQALEKEELPYTKEENKAALLRQIDEIEEAYQKGKISFKDKSSQIYAIRFRLQDKFDMERSGDERRIIVVPQKHDYICPYTHRECSKMPSKEACMEYYNLKE